MSNLRGTSGPESRSAFWPGGSNARFGWSLFWNNAWAQLWSSNSSKTSPRPKNTRARGKRGLRSIFQRDSADPRRNSGATGRNGSESLLKSQDTMITAVHHVEQAGRSNGHAVGLIQFRAQGGPGNPGGAFATAARHPADPTIARCITANHVILGVRNHHRTVPVDTQMFGPVQGRVPRRPAVSGIASGTRPDDRPDGTVG